MSFYRIKCDHCGTRTVATEPEEVMEQARKAGFVSLDSRHYCSKCVERIGAATLEQVTWLSTDWQDWE